MGRAYPDVAMVGHNLLIAQSGSFMTVGMSIFTCLIYQLTYLVDGTSASAPVFAGFITLINNVRVEAGKPLLGIFIC